MVTAIPIILASCRNPPVEPDDDPRLAASLQEAGQEVSTTPWTDIIPDTLPPGSLVILRSVWDYHRHTDRFLAWLDRCAARRITVLNPPELVRLGMDKSYLVQDCPFGCPAPVTARVRSDIHAVLREAATRRWQSFILKPPVSASADGLFHLHTEDRAAIEAALAGQPEYVLVQEFLPEIREGELSLIYFDGWFSHAVRKIPARGDFRVQSEFGSHTEPFRPAAPVIAAARRALLQLPEMPCYARVDGVMRGKDFVLMELELIEPELFLRHSPGAAEVFASAILRRLRNASALTALPPVRRPHQAERQADSNC